MPSERYSCVVIGLGAMGSAALYHLARRGVRALGIERFCLGHDLGSSHGPSRAFRTAYVDPLYTRLALEAEGMWRQLEDEAGEDLLCLVGLLAFASPGNEQFAATRTTFDQMQFAYEMLNAAEVRRRFDVVSLDEDKVAFFAERNGFLLAGRALWVLQEHARRRGATVWEETEVSSIEATGDGVVIQAGDRTALADSVVVTAGPWMGKVLADLDLPLRVTREQKAYFAVDHPERYGVGRLPVYVEFDTGIYGFPTHDGSLLKLAADHSGVAVDPDRVERAVDPEMIESLSGWVSRWMPESNPRLVDSAVCLYTCTPDLDFVIDRHPSLDNVVVAGGFSGHGFKFSVLVGDILADLVVDGKTARPIERFRLGRFDST